MPGGWNPTKSLGSNRRPAIWPIQENGFHWTALQSMKATSFWRFASVENWENCQVTTSVHFGLRTHSLRGKYCVCGPFMRHSNAHRCHPSAFPLWQSVWHLPDFRRPTKRVSRIRYHLPSSLEMMYDFDDSAAWRLNWIFDSSMFISHLTLSKLFCRAHSKFNRKGRHTKSQIQDISADSDVRIYLWKHGEGKSSIGQKRQVQMSLLGRVICRKSSAVVSGPQTFTTCHADPSAKFWSERGH